MTDHESIIISFKGKDVFAYVCIIETTNNMMQVQPETLPKNSNFSSCLQNIKLKNNTT